MVRIVKKTLKGDLMGRTGFKKVGQTKARKEAEPEGPTGPEGGPAGAPPERPTPQPVAEVRSLPTRLKPATQASLDALVRDDDLVVITQPLAPRLGKAIIPAKAEEERRREARQGEPSQGELDTLSAAQAAVASAKAVVQDGQSIPLARSILAYALYRDFGADGSRLEHPSGTSFEIASRWGEGTVRTEHSFSIPLPDGQLVSHRADIVVELDNKAILALDIVPSSIPVQEFKALAFDALQLRRLDRAFGVLVFVRTPGNGLDQGLAEAIGHGYDFHFGIDEAHAHQPERFAALRARLHTWLQAASGRGDRPKG